MTDRRLHPRTIYDDSMESLPDELQLLELGIVIVLFRLYLPRDWPWGVYIAVWLMLLVALTIVNYRIRRRFIPR
jgi:hypothetical protein